MPVSNRNNPYFKLAYQEILIYMDQEWGDAKNLPEGINPCEHGRTSQKSVLSASVSANEIALLYAQMRDMQMEIEILIETINVLKKTQASTRKPWKIGKRQ